MTAITPPKLIVHAAEKKNSITPYGRIHTESSQDVHSTDIFGAQNMASGSSFLSEKILAPFLTVSQPPGGIRTNDAIKGGITGTSAAHMSFRQLPSL